jgi:exodeoxyribonuclease VII small subunit
VATLPFDKSLEELRGVVARLEEGGLPLEESIALYERGVALHGHCASLLDSAELRVQRLVDGAAGAPRALDLRPDDGADE